MQTLTKRLLTWMIVVGGLLMIPLILTLRGSGVDGDGWHWTLLDFVWATVVLLGSAFTYELVARKATTTTYRVAVELAVVGSLMLIWFNGAAGIIGDGDNGSNLMYLVVLAIGFLSGIIVRFEPRGLTRVLFVMAVGIAFVPVAMFFLNRPELDKTPGIIGVFTLNMFFAGLFVVAGLLFRRASLAGSPGTMA